MGGNHPTRTLSIPANGLSPLAVTRYKNAVPIPYHRSILKTHIPYHALCPSDPTPRMHYKNNRPHRTDLSELLRYPGIARCNANQSRRLDQTTLVRRAIPINVEVVPDGQMRPVSFVVSSFPKDALLDPPKGMESAVMAAPT